MKKFLLGTSALAMMALPAAAQGAENDGAGVFKISAGVEYFVRSSSGTQTKTNLLQNLPAGKGVEFSAADGNSEVVFNYSNISDTGIEYQAEVQWQPLNEGGAIDEAWINIGGNWGTFILGDEDGVGTILGHTVMPNDGSDGGQWGMFIKTEGVADTPGLNVTGDASKIAYKTPRFYGFMGTVAFTPDTGSSLSESNADDNAGFHNMVEGGLNFTMMDKEQGWMTSISLATLAADSDNKNGVTSTPGVMLPTDRKDAHAWQIGGMVSYGQFSVGAAYGDRGDGNCSVAVVNCHQGTFRDIGVGYTVDDLELGLEYFYSTDNPYGKAGGNLYRAIFAEAHYHLAEGLGVYAGFKRASYDAGPDGDARTRTFLVGTRVSF